MVISKETLEKIKNIVENNYYSLLVTIAGKDTLTEAEIDQLKSAGYDLENKDSLLSLIYYNNVLNDLKTTTGPVSISEMIQQQRVKPTGAAFKAAEEHLNENFAQSLEKLKATVQAGIEGVIREYNLVLRNDSLQRLNRPEEMANLIRQSTVGGLKQTLRDLSKDADRNWQRVAVTETANALGLGSVDRVVAQNEGKDLADIYVYRIPVNDAALCKFCRKFYLDEDQTPAVYRMSTLLSNGTNYGKKAEAWKAVAGATHPNDRESGVLELRPGWKVIAGGKLEFIGQDAWQEYIRTKLRA